MSRETTQWLNQNTLHGFGRLPWHYDETAQGAESNIYPGAIPAEEVIRRLFSWRAVELPVEVGGKVWEGHKAITHSVTGDVFQVVSGTPNNGDGYKIHPYDQWLVEEIGKLGLPIGTAGLLKAGALAWVLFEMPESVKTVEGVEFKPYAMATSCLDSSMSTISKVGATLTVCDNTWQMFMGEKSDSVKIKHTRNSDERRGQMVSGVRLLAEVANTMRATVSRLTSWKVTTRAWDMLLDVVVPVPETVGRGLTLATTKRETLGQLYNTSPMVAPWRGTAFGVVQAFNTYDQHYSNVRGAERAERNTLNAITGAVEAQDSKVLAQLARIAPES